MSIQSSDKRKARAAVLSPPRWRGARSLELVYQLNDRCLALLSRAAASNDGQCPLALVNLHRNLWRRLEASARLRAAHLPFVLVDVHFTDSIWWQHARNDCTESQADMGEIGCFPKEIGEQLMNETLMFVWHAAQSDMRVACLTVGMSPEVSAIVAGLSAQELRDIAARHSSEIGPRWRDAPELWRALLVAAESNDENALADIHLQAQLLLCGTLVPHNTSGPLLRH